MPIAGKKPAKETSASAIAITAFRETKFSGTGTVSVPSPAVQPVPISNAEDTETTRTVVSRSI
jgi:hypothetical protein